MADLEKYTKARKEMEEAMQNFFRVVHDDDEGHMFLQDWAIILAGESMDPGQENKTFTHRTCRQGMSRYAVVGLATDLLDTFKNLGRTSE